MKRLFLAAAVFAAASGVALAQSNYTCTNGSKEVDAMLTGRYVPPSETCAGRVAAAERLEANQEWVEQQRAAQYKARQRAYWNNPQPRQ